MEVKPPGVTLIPLAQSETNLKQQVVQKCAPQLRMSKPARLLHGWRTCNGDPTRSTGLCLYLDFTTYFHSGVISPLPRQSDRSQVLWVKCLWTFTCLPGVSHLWILCSNNNAPLNNHIIQTEYICDVFLWGISHTKNTLLFHKTRNA